MKPHYFHGVDKVLGAPIGWDEATRGTCGGLPVACTDYGFYSCWKPSFVERLRVLLGWHVWLYVVGSGHPPVLLEVWRDDRFEV